MIWLFVIGSWVVLIGAAFLLEHFHPNKIAVEKDGTLGIYRDRWTSTFHSRQQPLGDPRE